MFTTDRVSVDTEKQAILSQYFMYVGTVDDCNIYYNTQTVVKGWYCMYSC